MSMLSLRCSAGGLNRPRGSRHANGYQQQRDLFALTHTPMAPQCLSHLCDTCWFGAQVASKGAGGTGKTTTSLSIAWGLAMAGKRVVIINADAQPSLEERCLDMLVGTHFDDNYEAFYNANGLGNETLLNSLMAIRHDSSGARDDDELRPLPPKVIGIDVQKLASPHQTGDGRCRGACNQPVLSR